MKLKHNNRMKLVFLFLNGWLALPAVAQLLPLQYYSRQNGLVADGVTALCQDSRGYLWIGTGEGLSVYDGAAFTNYTTRHGLPVNYITCIMESRVRPGTMWIGTLGGGLCKFQNGVFTSITLGPGHAAKEVNGLLEDPDGMLWCATPAAVYHVQNDHAMPFAVAKHDTSFTGLAQDAEGKVWIGLYQALLIFSPRPSSSQDSARWINSAVVNLDSIISGEITNLTADADSNVWVMTNDGLLLQARGAAIVRTRRLEGREPQDLIFDDEGRLWICTRDGLLLINKSNAGLARFTTANGFRNNMLNCALIDREKNLWIGGYEQGLYKWSERGIAIFPLRLEQGEYYHPAAAIDAQKHFWMVSQDGLVEIWRDHEKGWQSHTHAGNDPPSSPQYVKETGTLWAGFRNNKIHRFEIIARPRAHSWLRLKKEFRPGVELPKEDWLCFFADGDNALWLNVVSTGMYVLNLRTMSPQWLRLEDGVPNLDVRDIFKDRDGNIWLAGVSGGLSVFAPRPAGPKPKLLRRITKEHGLPDDRVRSLCEDEAGRMWIGTRHSGAIILDGDTIRCLSSKDGLLSDAVWWIADDGREKIWLGTQMGLQSVEKKSLQLGPGIPGLFLESVICCGVVDTSVVWAFTPTKFVVYESSHDRPNAIPPPVYITRFLVNAVDEPLPGEHRLAYDQNTCTFEFAGLSFREEAGVRYRYRMQGIDADWLPATSQRSVTYADLKPDAYVFEVFAINADGVPSQMPAALAFTIVPPFWQTWWFRILAGVIIAGILAMVYRYRVAKLLAIERTRLRIARDLHDEVGSTLSSISYFAEAIRSQAGAPAEKFLALISESSSHAKEAISDIIWSIDPANDDWEKTSAKLRRYASDLFESKCIRYQIDLPTAFPLQTMAMERRRDFWLAFKEMATNAARHSQCAEAKIQLTAAGKLFHLLVQDNGIGFDPEKLAPGNGVQNIRARTRSLKAHLDLQTAPGAGTRWELKFAA